MQTTVYYQVVNYRYKTIEDNLCSDKHLFLFKSISPDLKGYRKIWKNENRGHVTIENGDCIMWEVV